MKLDEIEKLCIEATPGPWDYCYDGSSDWCVGPKKDPQANQIASCHKFNAVENYDAMFIAASRELMPKLLEVAKAAKVINDTMIREHQYIYGAEILDKALEELGKE